MIVGGYTALVRQQPVGQLSLLPSARWEISTGQVTVAVFFGWEGNRRSDVALATRYRRSGTSSHGLNAYDKEISILTVRL